MIFKFIRYTQPGWQFNVHPQLNIPFASTLITGTKNHQIDLDKQFETESAQLADAGYRLWNKGLLLQSTVEDVEKLSQLPQPTIKDEYVFLNKYWGKPWAAFALLLRIATFKNIFTELKGFFAARKTKRINPHNNPVEISEYKTFASSLLKEEPLVAVIIPTLNRYKYLKDVMTDLEKQTYKNFEVIVFDQSDEFDENFYKQFSLKINAQKQKEKKLWTARNNAVKITAAPLLLFFDDDSRVEPDWIEQHIKCIDFFNADISAGVSLATVGSKIAESYNYFRWADQFDSGNAMVKRNVFKSIGLFDEQFNGMRMGDGEFGFRAYINGFKSISNPLAKRVHLKVSSGGLREMGSWDGFRPTKWFAPKPIPSVVYLFKKYLPTPLYKNAILIGIMLSNVSYKQKKKSSMLALSVFITVIKSPLLYIQYLRSLNIAKHMLNNNYKPEILAE